MSYYLPRLDALPHTREDDAVQQREPSPAAENMSICKKGIEVHDVPHTYIPQLALLITAWKMFIRYRPEEWIPTYERYVPFTTPMTVKHDGETDPNMN